MAAPQPGRSSRVPLKSLSGNLEAVADVSWLTRTQKELHRPLRSVVGNRAAKAFDALGVHDVGDLLGHLPRRYLTGTQNTDLSDLVVGTEVALIADVSRVEIHDIAGGAGSSARQRLEVTLTDGRATLPVTFFGRKWLVAYWSKQFTVSSHGIFVGKVTSFRDKPQLTHPDFVMFDETGQVVGRADKKTMASQVMRNGLVGLYPASSKLPTWTIAETIDLVLTEVGRLDDTLPDWLVAEADLAPLAQAYEWVHRPSAVSDAAKGAERLLWEEAIATQVTMAHRRQVAATRRAPACPHRDDGIAAAFDARLPFTLTEGQEQVGETISADLAADAPMQRLLQGEVGSGKTLVALRAMLQVVDAGHQAVLLAPTEVLARQHWQTITSMLGDLGGGQVLGAPENATDVVLLTGSMRTASARQARARIADGQAGIVIGTHALLSGTVQFADIGLVVVDEQHRFGVAQRGLLTARDDARPHELVLTATPIPRTVAMTVFGDLEVSTLAQLPSGRAEVQTTVVDLPIHQAWLDRAWQRVREEVDAGHQVFIVCPRIGADDAEMGADPGMSRDAGGRAGSGNLGGVKPAASVEELGPRLARGPLNGLRIEALHSRLDAEEKEAIMARFTEGESQVLIATTVIEVGVDVPNATMMVIMDADRFGVSQLHQLRGRIGRGQYPGLCLLVTSAAPDTPARTRLDAVASTRDGFRLAELDLAQRHEGNVLGANQSGRSVLSMLRVLDHADVITAAKDLATRWVSQDPDDPRLADMVRSTEELATDDLMEQG